MKRSAKRPNSFSQEFNGLTPGRLYSLKMITGDYQEMVNGESGKALHAVSIRLGNADILPGEEHSLQSPFPHGRSAGQFGGENKYWMNYHWRVFRAKSTTARLTVTDWRSEAEPGGPAGLELVFNFVEIQTYFEG